MAISGAHVIVYSREPEADRAFFRDVLDYPHVDAGGGWLIFRLPPAEVAVHPGEDTSSQELWLMCDDLDTTMSELSARGVRCTDITEARWGRLSRFAYPAAGMSASMNRVIHAPPTCEFASMVPSTAGPVTARP